MVVYQAFKNFTCLFFGQLPQLLLYILLAAAKLIPDGQGDSPSTKYTVHYPNFIYFPSLNCRINGKIENCRNHIFNFQSDHR